MPDGNQAMTPGGRSPYPNLRFAAHTDWKHVNPTLLRALQKVAAAQGVQVDVISGYRSNSYSAAHGGFAGDPHTKGLAVDAYVGGRPIGEVIAPSIWASAGVRSGAQAGFYQGKSDPEHLDLMNASGSAPAISTPAAPPELASAIARSAKKYGVDPGVLTGIWKIESGSKFPNPYKNSLGYGGLFGTKNWNGSTQAQADLAAKILANLIKTKGSLSQALLAYSGGGYSSVDGSGAAAATDTGGTPTAPPATGQGQQPQVSPDLNQALANNLANIEQPQGPPLATVATVGLDPVNTGYDRAGAASNPSSLWQMISAQGPTSPDTQRLAQLASYGSNGPPAAA